MNLVGEVMQKFRTLSIVIAALAVAATAAMAQGAPASLWQVTIPAGSSVQIGQIDLVSNSITNVQTLAAGAQLQVFLTSGSVGGSATLQPGAFCLLPGNVPQAQYVVLTTSNCTLTTKVSGAVGGCVEKSATTTTQLQVNTAALGQPPTVITLDAGAQVVICWQSLVAIPSTGTQVTLGKGQAIRFRATSSGPWQAGVVEAPIMITVN
jgi:hypothetical protein